MKISLYTVYHKKSHLINSHYIKPIQVGYSEEIIGENNQPILRDNTGHHITEKNATFCELTAQYWAWKNDQQSDYIGLMHYRRFFDFRSIEDRSLDSNGIILEPSFLLNFFDKYGLDEDNIRKEIEEYDLILPTLWDVKKIGRKNIRQHYIKSPYHHQKDLSALEELITEKYPDYCPFLKEHLEQSKGFFNNMFIMKKALFDEYSQWLFSLLFELENRLNISMYDEQEKRVFGYLSERLLNIWVSKKIADNQNLKIKYLERVFIENTSPKKYQAILPPNVNPNHLISIVIASDNNYAPHLGALIVSIMENFNQDYFLDLIILDGGISDYNRQLLTRLTQENHFTHLQFLDLKDEFSHLNVHMHFSKATFFRLILDKLITDRERVLYIDCDTIALDDVSQLFFTNLQGKAIGAVYDYIMHHFCQMNVPSISTTGSLRSKDYLMNYVGLKEYWDQYFQAGVILFDLKKLRELDLSQVMIKSLLEKTYWFLDQDILNKYFSNNVFYLDPAWNVINCGDEIMAGLSEKQKYELQVATNKPKLIHYAGFDTKPWNNVGAKFNEYYFYYLRKTHWYEKIILFFINQKIDNLSITPPPPPYNNLINNASHNKNKYWHFCRSIWLKFPYPIKRILNPFKELVKRALR